MPPGDESARRDRVVVMARGLSSRMGTPKGLLRLIPTGPTFLRSIAALYGKMALPVDVVCTDDMAEIYQGEWADLEEVRSLPAESGGDTALTLLAAWRSWRAEGISCTHLWAHPVDLPLVAEKTVRLLRDISGRKPDRIIRPQFEGVPGHPVILPAKVLEVLEGRKEWQAGPLRDFLSWAVAAGRVSEAWAAEVPDRGIIQDFDRPADLGRPGLSEKDRGNP